MLVAVSVTFSSAQKKTTGLIKGKLQDTVFKESLSQATISLLLPADSSIVTYTLANAKGEFELKDVELGTYRLLITFSGYATVKTTVTLSDSSSTADLGNIFLERKSTLLEEVVVELPPVQIKKDTVEFNAAAFKTKPNSTAEDLLKKLPGVEVDKDGNVKAQGEDVQKIYVDGKEFFGNDPKMATKNITADMIASVQVFDDMSEQAKFTRIDDGSRSKTINIKLKKDRRKGYFGRGTVGVGTDDRYLANITMNRFNEARRISLVTSFNNLNRQGFSFNDIVTNMGGFSGGGGGGGGFGGGGQGRGGRGGSGFGGGNNGLTRTSSVGLNYTDKIGTKVELAASYFFSESDTRTSSLNFRQSRIPVDSITYESELSTSRNKNQNHRFNLRFEYYIDSMNSIMYTPSLILQKSSRFSNDTTFTRVVQPVKDYIALSGINENTNEREGLNLNNNLLYRRRFSKTGRTFTLGWSNSINKSSGTGTNFSPLTFYDSGGGIDSTRLRDFRSSQETNSNNNVLSSSYTEPLGKNKILEINYAYTNNRSNSDREASNYNPVTKLYDSLNPQQTNYFENDFLAHRLGMNFRLQNLKYGFQIGAAMQNSDLESKSIRAIYRVNGKDSIVEYKQSYTNFFPTANFNYNFNRSKVFRLNYRGRTNQPGVNQLQDVRDESNSLRTVVGNPNLKQEFTNIINASYNSYNPTTSKYLNVNLNYHQTSNKIVNSVDLDTTRGRGVQLIKPINTNGSFNASSSITVGIPFRKKLKGSSINFSNSINYNRDISLLYKQRSITNTMSIRQRIGLNMDIKEKLNFELSGSVTYHNVIYGGQTNTSNSKVNADNEYFTQSYSVDVSYFITKDFITATDFDYLINSGLASGFNQNVPVWNASIAQQLFKKKNGQVKLSVNDILNQNQSINRNITDNYIQDTRTVVLKRYFLLTFTYNLNRAGQRRNNNTQGGGERSERPQREAGQRGGGQRGNNN